MTCGSAELAPMFLLYAGCHPFRWYIKADRAWMLLPLLRASHTSICACPLFGNLFLIYQNYDFR
jgi:hypothetical protein